MTDDTPLMRQYREIKKMYRDAVLLFRVGDFYEMFYEDAVEASRLLSITLTSRDKHKTDPVPLCGVPYHAATGYIAKLLAAGRTVAVCDQVEDPKQAKGLVRREVTRVFTPGTLVDMEFLPPAESNFLAAVSVSETTASSTCAGLAALDCSTGELWVMECRGAAAQAELLDELYRVDPKEALVSSALSATWRAAIEGRYTGPVTVRDSVNFDRERSVRILKEHFRVTSLDGFGCRGLGPCLDAAAAILRYVGETQPTASLAHVANLRVRHTGEMMRFDAATIRNLELIKPLSDGRRDATLLGVLDRTVSPMGARLLRDWLLRPLVSAADINARLDAVEELYEQLAVRCELRRLLKGVQDLARLGSRISLGMATPRDLMGLRQSAAVLPAIRHVMQALHAPILRSLADRWDDLADLHEIIERAIAPDPPATIRDGGIIRDGYSAELDELRKACHEGKTWIAELETTERAKTGIDSLRIRFNQVFGYYIEVTKTHSARIPSDRYMRKQTLVNAERYTTAELEELEHRVTGADLKTAALERDLFSAVRALLAGHTSRVHESAAALAVLDVLTGFADTAASNRYCRPCIDDGDRICISEGRHPVVERLAPGGFIPNDVHLDGGENRLLILTGPNMAGKSTYLRQIALTVVMAQIGCFVPAREALLGIADRIFTRVGASDSLAEGHSTFMVEMIETANILNCATPRSLVFLDEIGRGTSTYDGLSIAWAVAEYLHDRSRIGARTLFATHYHEMTELAAQRNGVKNYTVAVLERNDEVVFLRKIVPGGADRSYGIHVARLAGFPPAVLDRARDILRQLERGDTRSGATIDDEGAAITESSAPVPPAHHIIEEVRQMDLFSMTPLEAMNRLAELQRRLEHVDT